MLVHHRDDKTRLLGRNRHHDDKRIFSRICRDERALLEIVLFGHCRLQFNHIQHNLVIGHHNSEIRENYIHSTRHHYLSSLLIQYLKPNQSLSGHFLPLQKPARAADVFGLKKVLAGD